MGTSFPTGLDSHPSAATLAAHTLATDPHSTLHGDLGAAIDALEAKVGVDSSAVTTSLDYKLAHNVLLLAAGGASVANAGNINSNVNTVATSGSTQTLDTTTYAVHDITMSTGCTFTFSNPIASGKNTTFVLILRGAQTPTLPASVKWSGGSVPTYTTPSVYVFTTVDGGTTWYAQQVGKAFA